MGDSLNCPEGEEILSLDNQFINSPKLSVEEEEKAEPPVDSIEEKSDTVLLEERKEICDKLVTDIEGSVLMDKKETAVGEEIVLGDQEVNDTPYSGTVQPELESFHSLVLTEQVTPNPSTGTTITPNDATMIMEKLLAEESTEGNGDADTTSAETCKKEAEITNNEQQQSSLLETQINDYTAVINSLEIASHQQQQVPQDLPHNKQDTSVMTEEGEETATIMQQETKNVDTTNQSKYNTAMKEEKDDSPASEKEKDTNDQAKIQKRKSTQSLIPRKQQAIAVVEEDPATIKSKASFSKIPVKSTTAVPTLISNPSFNYAQRRSSSCPFNQQQKQRNRLSLFMPITENIWSPSLEEKSTSPTISTHSSSSAGVPSRSSSMENRSAKAQHRLSGINLLQQSKIPTVAAAFPHTNVKTSNQRALSPALSSNVNAAVSRLPKRNSTILSNM